MARIQQIATDYVFPPIPDRSWDWAAWLAGQEDEGMLIGRGPTKPAAIADLIEQLWAVEADLGEVAL